MLGVIKNISEFHKKNVAEPAMDYQLCQNYTHLAQLITIGTPIAYYGLANIYQLPAFCDIFRNGIVVVGVDESDVIDMSVLLLINIVYAASASNVEIATDTFIYISFSTNSMFSTIVQRQINDFGNELKENRKTADLRLMKKSLVEIIELQKNFYE